MFSFSIEIQDAGLFLHNNCTKSVIAPMHEHRSILPKPQIEFEPILGPLQLFKDPILHHVGDHLIADHLERTGFVRACTINWLEIFVDQDRTAAFNDINITGGVISIGTCRDSLETLKEIIGYLAENFIETPKIDEVELLLPESEDSPDEIEKFNLDIDKQSDELEDKDEVPIIHFEEPLLDKEVPENEDYGPSPVLEPLEAPEIKNFDLEKRKPKLDLEQKKSSSFKHPMLAESPIQGEPFMHESVPYVSGIPSNPFQMKKSNSNENRKKQKRVYFNEELDGPVDPTVEPPDQRLADEIGDPLQAPQFYEQKPHPEKKKFAIDILGGIDDHMFGENDINFNSFGIDDDDTEDENEAMFQKEIKVGGATVINNYAANEDVDRERELSPKHEEESEQSGVLFNQDCADQSLIDDYVVPEARSKAVHPYLTRSYPNPQNKVSLKELSFHWTIYGGTDWSTESADSSPKKSEEENLGVHDYEQTEEIQGIKDYIPSSPEPYSRKLLKGPKRSLDNVIQVRLDKLTIYFYQFGKSESVANRMVVHLNQLDILDQLEKSNFHKLLTRQRMYGTDTEDMFAFSMDIVRPDPKNFPDREEARVRVTILPIRLNVDQHAVNFLIKYFKPKKTEKIEEEIKLVNKEHGFSVSTTKAQNEDTKDLMKQQDDAPFFIQDFMINPIVLSIDYKPRRVDFSQLTDGDYSQLIHLFPLKKVEIILPKFSKSGMIADRLVTELAKFWALDVAKNQPHKYLCGVQPVRSVVNVGSGMADLVIMPLRQFKEDGRLLKGLGKGAYSFVKSLTQETLHVGSTAFSTAAKILGTVDTAVDTATRHKKRRRPLVKQRRRKTPNNAYEGVVQAYELLTRGLIDAGQGVVAVPREEYKRSGVLAATKSVLCGIPLALLRPIVGATEAVSVVMDGLQSSVNPEDAKERKDKYK